MNRLLATIFLAAALTACGDSSNSDAQHMKDTLSGDAIGTASTNPLCKLFSPAELSNYVGGSLSDGQNAGMGLGCQWITDDENGDVMIMIVPKDYHEAPRLAEGYTELPAIGSEGFVAPQLGGWTAASIVGEESIRVSVAGETASAATAEALLKETIKRHGGAES